MKITKKRLKQIIKEELALVLEDSFASTSRDWTQQQTRQQTDTPDWDELTKRREKEYREVDPAGESTSIYTDTNIAGTDIETGRKPFKRTLKRSPYQYSTSHRERTGATGPDRGFGGKEVGAKSTRSTTIGGKKISQSGRPEDIGRIGGGQSTVTINDKVLKPGSKRYAAALNALERAETVGAEAEIAQNRPEGGYIDTGVDLLADEP
tara:strand:- start:27 stop:650 length:624 start_codon:yes stop_codon:yes gene_type:complete